VNKEQLGTDLLKKLEPMVEQFASQPSPRALEAREKLAEIEEKKAGAAKLLGEGTAAYKAAVRALEEDEKACKVNESFQRKQNLQLFAEALVYVCNHLRVPVKLKDAGGPTQSAGKSSGGSGGGKRTRKTAEAMQQESDAVLKALPSASGKYVSKADIETKVGFDPTSALLKLKRDGDAESNGMRGSAGGWRKA
jgi:hypothetical protein